ncbi:glycosyltransferase family 2 protein [Larkinella bovis]|uniref:Glycosyltransferase family 2 protein n=1 Tax=Larkinella bovis TaxID=683041 RepID=A0ABW0IPK9_9BACT
MPPKLICLTPVRNEAWILDAFLKCTSLWADFIIIADQGSTDGSKDIALRYKKVILIENSNTSMHQAQVRKMLFDESKKIKGNKVIFSLDADEFLSGDFTNTIGWESIVSSKNSNIFWFKWINLCYPYSVIDKKEAWMYWACSVIDNEWDGFFPYFYIHEWRLPYPKKRANEVFINDIKFVHFARINKKCQLNKEIFYQAITKYHEPDICNTTLFRSYNDENNYTTFPVDESLFSYYKKREIDIFSYLNIDDEGVHYLEEVNKFIKIKGVEYFSGLSIWNEDFLIKYNLKDPRSYLIKFLHYYLQLTQKYKANLSIRIIDYILKSFKI